MKFQNVMRLHLPIHEDERTEIKISAAINLSAAAEYHAKPFVYSFINETGSSQSEPNKFIVCRSNRNKLDIEEHSLDRDIQPNKLTLQFTESCLVPGGVRIAKVNDELHFHAVTLSATYRFIIPNRNAGFIPQLRTSAETLSSSDLAALPDHDKKMLPTAATSYSCPAYSLYALGYPDGSVLLFNRSYDGRPTVYKFIKESSFLTSMMPLFSSKILKRDQICAVEMVNLISNGASHLLAITISGDCAMKIIDFAAQRVLLSIDVMEMIGLSSNKINTEMVEVPKLQIEVIKDIVHLAILVPPDCCEESYASIIMAVLELKEGAFNISLIKKASFDTDCIEGETFIDFTRYINGFILLTSLGNIVNVDSNLCGARTIKLESDRLQYSPRTIVSNFNLHMYTMTDIYSREIFAKGQFSFDTIKRAMEINYKMVPLSAVQHGDLATLRQVFETYAENLTKETSFTSHSRRVSSREATFLNASDPQFVLKHLELIWNDCVTLEKLSSQPLGLINLDPLNARPMIVSLSGFHVISYENQSNVLDVIDHFLANCTQSDIEEIVKNVDQLICDHVIANTDFERIKLAIFAMIEQRSDSTSLLEASTNNINLPALCESTLENIASQFQSYSIADTDDLLENPLQTAGGVAFLSKLAFANLDRHIRTLTMLVFIVSVLNKEIAKTTRDNILEQLRLLVVMRDYVFNIVCGDSTLFEDFALYSRHFRKLLNRCAKSSRLGTLEPHAVRLLLSLVHPLNPKEYVLKHLCYRLQPYAAYKLAEALLPILPQDLFFVLTHYQALAASKIAVSNDELQRVYEEQPDRETLLEEAIKLTSIVVNGVELNDQHIMSALSLPVDIPVGDRVIEYLLCHVLPTFDTKANERAISGAVSIANMALDYVTESCPQRGAIYQTLYRNHMSVQNYGKALRSILDNNTDQVGQENCLRTFISELVDSCQLTTIVSLNFERLSHLAMQILKEKSHAQDMTKTLSASDGEAPVLNVFRVLYQMRINLNEHQKAAEAAFICATRYHHDAVMCQQNLPLSSLLLEQAKVWVSMADSTLDIAKPSEQYLLQVLPADALGMDQDKTYTAVITKSELLACQVYYSAKHMLVNEYQQEAPITVKSTYIALLAKREFNIALRLVKIVHEATQHIDSSAHKDVLMNYFDAEHVPPHLFFETLTQAIIEIDMGIHNDDYIDQLIVQNNLEQDVMEFNDEQCSLQHRVIAHYLIHASKHLKNIITVADAFEIVVDNLLKYVKWPEQDDWILMLAMKLDVVGLIVPTLCAYARADVAARLLTSYLKAYCGADAILKHINRLVPTKQIEWTLLVAQNENMLSDYETLKKQAFKTLQERQNLLKIK